MKIVIPGGNGQVGEILTRAFEKNGDEVVIVSRQSSKTVKRRTTDWENLGREIDGADIVINLAGRSVNCRYTEKNRREISDSRVETTQKVGAAIAAATNPPTVWLQASTATIYAHRYDAANDETTGIIGGDEPNVPETWRFSIGVAKAWEKALHEAKTPQTRKIALRSAMVMSPDQGGVFDVLSTLVRRGLGGGSGDGRQYVSWIHDADFVASVKFLIAHTDIDGPVNLSSPNPIPNEAFMYFLRDAWKMPLGLPAADWMLEIGARFLQTETELILKSRRVTPGVLTGHGFSFALPTWPEASRDLVARRRKL